MKKFFVGLCAGLIAMAYMVFVLQQRDE